VLHCTAPLAALRPTRHKKRIMPVPVFSAAAPEPKKQQPLQLRVVPPQPPTFWYIPVDTPGVPAVDLLDELTDEEWREQVEVDQREIDRLVEHHTLLCKEKNELDRKQRSRRERETLKNSVFFQKYITKEAKMK